MRGYKVFNPDWTRWGFQYEVGKTYEIEDKPKCYEVGFHFCKEFSGCFRHYLFGLTPDNKVAIIEALGDIDKRAFGSICCTNKIKIVEELNWKEKFKMFNFDEDIFREAIRKIISIDVGEVKTDE